MSIEILLSSVPVEQLNLSVNTRNILIRAEINTALEVQEHIEQGTLFQIKRIGPRVAQEIEEAIASLLETMGVDPAEFSLSAERQLDPGEVKIPDKYFDGLPIEILLADLGGELLERLKSAGFENVGELNQLSRIISNFRSRNSIAALQRLVGHHKQLLQTQITQKRLHPSAKYQGASLETWLNATPSIRSRQLDLLNTLAQLNETHSLTQEITSLLSRFSERELAICLSYFSTDKTYEKIGKESGITRERVRQIATGVSTTMWDEMNKKPGVYFQSSLLWAVELGDRVSLVQWKQLLLDRAIIEPGIIFEELDSFAVLCAILRSSKKAKNPPEIEISQNLHFILKRSSNLSLATIRAIERVTRKSKREVRSRIGYMGGIRVDDAAHILGVTSEQAVAILEDVGFKEVLQNWYTAADKNFKYHLPILEAGLAMMEVCGPLEFDSFCDGLRRSVSRFYQALAPTEVITAHLEVLGVGVQV